MKKLFSIISLVLLMFFVNNLNAQNDYVDVIYLKNNVVLKGEIINQDSNYITIKTKDGNFLPAKKEIAKITRELGMPIKNDYSLIHYRDPIVSTVFSMLIPGLGQYYNHQNVKGTIFLLSGIACAGLNSYAYTSYIKEPKQQTEDILLFSSLATLTIWISSMVDANLSSKNINIINNLTYFDLGNNNNLCINPNISYDRTLQNSFLTYGLNMKLSF